MNKHKYTKLIIIVISIIALFILGINYIVNAANVSKEDVKNGNYDFTLKYAEDMEYGYIHHTETIKGEIYNIFCRQHKDGSLFGSSHGNPTYYYQEVGSGQRYTTKDYDAESRKMAYLLNKYKDDIPKQQNIIWASDFNLGVSVDSREYNNTEVGEYEEPEVKINSKNAKTKSEGDNYVIGPLVATYSGGNVVTINDENYNGLRAKISNIKIINAETDREICIVNGNQIEGETGSGKQFSIKISKNKLDNVKKIKVKVEINLKCPIMTTKLYVGSGYRNNGDICEDESAQHMMAVHSYEYPISREDESKEISITQPRIITTKYLKKIEHENGSTYNIPESWNKNDWEYENQKPTVKVNINEDVDANSRYELTKQNTDPLNITYGDKITYNIRLYNIGNADADFTDKDLDLGNTMNEPNVLKKEGDYYYIYDSPDDNLEFIPDSRYKWEKDGNKYKIKASDLGTIRNYEENKDNGIDSWSTHVVIQFKIGKEKNNTKVKVINNGNTIVNRDDTVRKFLYSFESKDDDGTYQTYKLKEPTAKVDTNYPVGDENRFKYTLSNAPTMHLMDGDTVTYCIRYYSIGKNSTYLSYSIPDEFGEGLIFEKVVRQDNTSIGYTKNGNTLQIDPPNVELEGYEEGKEVPHYDIYLTFKVSIQDPSKVPLLTNKIKGNDGGIQVNIRTAYEIKGKVFKDKLTTSDGKVTSPRDALYSGEPDELVEGIQVELLEMDGTPARIVDEYTSDPKNLSEQAKQNIEKYGDTLLDTSGIYHNVTYTDENGQYTFTHLPSRELTIEPDGSVSGDKDISRPYKVRFTYNGQVYENIEYGKNNSKEASYSTEDNKEREDFNQKFGIIDSNTSTSNGGTNENPNTIYDSDEYYKNRNIDTKEIRIYDDIQNSSSIKIQKGYKPKDATCPKHYAIKAYSGKEDRAVNVDTAYREYVNLGVLERHFDLSIENKLVSMDVSINGVNQTLESMYGGIITETLLDEDIYFKESDYNYLGNNELSVWVNYEVTIKNESNDNFIGQLNSLNFYYDERFDGIRVEGSQNDISGVIGFKGSNIKFGQNQIKNNADGALTINISLHLSRETIKKAIEESTNELMRTFETIAEIESYSNYYDGDMYNNGHTGIAGKIDEDSDAGNLSMTEYIGGVRQSTDPKTILSFFNKEDDAKRALGIKLKKDINDNEKRKLVGTVFEDATTKQNNTRLGNGKYDSSDNDKPVSGATVELYEGEYVAEVYNNNLWDNAEAKTDSNGNYTIEGFIPSANYSIKITYGDGNTRIYNAQDYKSTIDKTANNYQPPTLVDGDKQKNAPYSQDGKEYWYARSDVENKSVAKDEDMKMNKTLILTSKTATYLEESYNNAGTRYNADVNMDADECFKNTAVTEKIFAPIRWLGNTKTDSDNYQIKNINLGLAERPRAELRLTKEVDHISIVATDGSTIVDGTVDQKENGGVKGISWTPRYVQPIIDENLIYGSTMKVTYKFKIENTGEVDYYRDNNTRIFYDYGVIEKDGVILNEDDIVTTKPISLVDYVDNKFIYDENTESYDGKKNSSYWNPLTEDEGKMQGLLANNFDYSSINKILKYTGNMEELKPGDSTGYIAYLTFEKVLSDANAEDLLTYNNYAEIIKSENSVGRRSYSTWSKNADKNECYLLSDINYEDKNENKGGTVGKRGIPIITIRETDSTDEYVLTIPGNLDPETKATLYDPINANGGYAPYGEPDTDQAQEIQIIQPFGASTSQKILIWTITGVSAGLILAAGIYLIKKKVL